MLKKTAMYEFLLGRTRLGERRRLWVLNNFKLHTSEDVTRLHSARVANADAFSGG
jgi:hypothetical protein